MNFRGRYKPDTVGFQIAPLIDIMLFLLCFFITLQIFMQWETEIDIQLPAAKTAQPNSRMPGEIILNLKKSGEVTVNGRKFNDGELIALLGRLVSKDTGFPDQQVLLRADRDATYQQVVHVLDLCGMSNVRNISFAIGAGEVKPAVP